jgi:hypothetical protein
MTEADNAVLRGLMQAQSALKWVDENWTKPAADRGAGLPSCRAALAAVEAGLLALSDARSETERLRGLILKAEWEGNTSRDPEPACPWCGADKFGTPRETHQPDCPAFSAAGVVR